jgi:hypothetical protein
MTDFTYCECPVCEYSVVVLTSELGDGAYKVACPICHEDNNRMVAMTPRPARDGDKPEGIDARARPMPRFICASCARECLSPLSEDEALVEFEQLYGMRPDPAKHLPICDDCFRAVWSGGNRMKQ